MARARLGILEDDGGFGSKVGPAAISFCMEDFHLVVFAFGEVVVVNINVACREEREGMRDEGRGKRSEMQMKMKGNGLGQVHL